jgi:hypothetical protein
MRSASSSPDIVLAVHSTDRATSGFGKFLSILQSPACDTPVAPAKRSDSGPPHEPAGPFGQALVSPTHWMYPHAIAPPAKAKGGAVQCRSYTWRDPWCYMTFPPKPDNSYDYITFQTNDPTDPLPATEVAGDFADHKASIDAVIEFQKLVQRSDGRLNNGSVRPETLSAGTVALIGKWTLRGNWLTATDYAINDLVTESDNLYVYRRPYVRHVCPGSCRRQVAVDRRRHGAAGRRQHVHGRQHLQRRRDMTGGTPTVPTASVGDNDTSAASTASVQAATGKVYVQIFTGSGTYTPHAGMVNCIIECWGGGGAAAEQPTPPAPWRVLAVAEARAAILASWPLRPKSAPPRPSPSARPARPAPRATMRAAQAATPASVRSASARAARAVAATQAQR